MTKMPPDDDSQVLTDRAEHLKTLATQLKKGVAKLVERGIRDEQRRAQRRTTVLLVPRKERRTGRGRRHDDTVPIDNGHQGAGAS